MVAGDWGTAEHFQRHHLEVAVDITLSWAVAEGAAEAVFGRPTDVLLVGVAEVKDPFVGVA